MSEDIVPGEDEGKSIKKWAKKSDWPHLFIVWSPDGPTPPKVSYKKHKSAHFAAQAMAKKHPGQTFYVMAKGGKPIIASEPEAPTPTPEA